MCMVDACLRIDGSVVGDGRLVQVAKDPRHNCYCGIPIHVAVKPAEHDVQRLRCFLTTAFAGGAEERFIDMAVEALSWYGITQPPVQVSLWCRVIPTGA